MAYYDLTPAVVYCGWAGRERAQTHGLGV